MSATPLKNLILAVAVVGFSTVALTTGQFDSIVARTASDFATAQVESGTELPSYTQNSPYGIWSFEFE